MEIKGFIKTSLVDWDGKVSSVIFLPMCTFRCPWCYAKDLVVNYERMRSIGFVDIRNYLLKNRKIIDGVVITGGEPTIHPDLPQLCVKIKKLGFPIKLDTNGTNPAMVKLLVRRRLIDYVAVDVKAPLDEESYNKVNGNKNLLQQVKESIAFVMRCGIDYEFRTTIVPGLHSLSDIERIGKEIAGARKWAIQNFIVPFERDKLIDARYYTKKPLLEAEIKKFFEVAKRYAEKVTLRI